jgi:hypothetical protein
MGKRAALLAASMAAGCAIVTGSTDGYYAVVADAGCGDSGVAGACPAPACTSSADCGDSGAVCCLVTVASIRTTTVCMPPPCAGALPVQLCRGAGSDECSDGGTCTTQMCSGSLLPLHACGVLPGCTAVP